MRAIIRVNDAIARRLSPRHCEERSNISTRKRKNGLLRRFAPRNDVEGASPPRFAAANWRWRGISRNGGLRNQPLQFGMHERNWYRR